MTIMNENENVKQLDYSHEVAIVANPFLRWVCLSGGTISIVLGLIGIFLPLLPTTPFLLLAAYLYSKSSVRYYNWLMNHRRLGPFIRNYREGKGIPLEVKISALTFLWITILTSSYYVVNRLEIRVLLIGIACLVSWHISSLPTLSLSPSMKKES